MIVKDGVLLGIEKKDIKTILTKQREVEKVVVLPREVHTIGREAFKRAKIDTVVYTSNLKEIENKAFYGSSVERMFCEGSFSHKGTICLDKNVETVGEGAFSYCNKILGVKIDTKHIGNAAFENCKMIGVVYCGKNVKEIGNFAFKGCENLMKFNSENRNMHIGIGVFTFDSNLNLGESSKEEVLNDYPTSEDLKQYTEDFIKENKKNKNSEYEWVEFGNC